MKQALIVGAGSGLSAALTRALTDKGYQVALAARNTDKLDDLVKQTGAQAFSCDAINSDSVSHLFAQLDEHQIEPDFVLYNASGRTAGNIEDLDPNEVQQAIMQCAFGAFLVAQQAARRMKVRGKGALFFTGATAGVKGFPRFASFAMGKFALRGLAQSLARELGPHNIHVAHFNIDGGIASPAGDIGQTNPTTNPDDAMLEPDAIAATYLSVLEQHRSAWSQEIDLRPWCETF